MEEVFEALVELQDQLGSLGNTALWDVFQIFCPFIAENLLLFIRQSKIPSVKQPGLCIIWKFQLGWITWVHTQLV